MVTGFAPVGVQLFVRKSDNSGLLTVTSPARGERPPSLEIISWTTAYSKLPAVSAILTDCPSILLVICPLTGTNVGVPTEAPYGSGGIGAGSLTTDVYVIG